MTNLIIGIIAANKVDLKNVHVFFSFEISKFGKLTWWMLAYRIVVEQLRSTDFDLIDRRFSEAMFHHFLRLVLDPLMNKRCYVFRMKKQHKLSYQTKRNYEYRSEFFSFVLFFSRFDRINRQTNEEIYMNISPIFFHWNKLRNDESNVRLFLEMKFNLFISISREKGSSRRWVIDLGQF